MIARCQDQSRNARRFLTALSKGLGATMTREALCARRGNQPPGNSNNQGPCGRHSTNGCGGFSDARHGIGVARVFERE